ncbi:hypothetical protein [Herbaspirillum sp.]|uniref:hypothetical protein n=1 Tax=Herbaspirillum sp. TaxID=1890675 RepID=UPI00257F347F|nr:hypothetical protein [Herbaspirillum sp.]|tara:strand:- start:1554 stop:2054 length:501 start_codon:yes stop_codon:yes gene_type:complete
MARLIGQRIFKSTLAVKRLAELVMTNVEKNNLFSHTDLEYPVLMSGQGYMSIFKNADALTTCSSTAFENSVYQKSNFIDASGAQFRVSSVEKKGFAKPFFGFRLMTARQMIVDLSFLKMGDLTFSDVVREVSNTIKNSNWGADPDFFEGIVVSSKTTKEFFEALAK